MQLPRIAWPVVLAVAPALFFSCAVDSAPAGLRATPPGTGPTVVFDMTARPLPNIPAPNDIATVADPTSRTGRRINASLTAPTRIESEARVEFDEMEGWGTFAPIYVSFAREAGADPRVPAIDLAEVRSRMQGNGHDFSDDAVYLVNLTTGLPVLLDMGDGNFPATVQDTNGYFPNDPRASEQNILYETYEEGAGLAQADYRPSLDTDFDGVLDHPDTLAPPGGGPTAGGPPFYPGIDDLLTWYERETDTLILRPLLPLDEKTEYAVVLTDRLRAPDGQAVRSPFPYIHHPAQRDSVAKLATVLGDGSRTNDFGTIAGTGFDHVAFAWTFTTEPVVEDMLLLRDGIWGKGPFARFAADYPAKLELFPTVGLAVDPSDEPAGWQEDSRCVVPAKTPFIVSYDQAKGALGPFIGNLFPFGPAALQAFEDSLEYVDYFVVGTFQSPYLIGDPTSADPDLHFHLNFMTGEGDVTGDAVHFWIAIPKQQNGRQAPFPVAYWRHGFTVNDAEILVHAGQYARQGIALAGFDAVGHGLVLTPGQQFLLEGLLGGSCLKPLSFAMSQGRAIDLNGDGVPDSGGLALSAHLFHTRDSIRQSVLDGVQFTRILRTFDGVTMSDQDYNADGVPDLAGDFNGDGVVDLGGPNAPYYNSGGSYGGIGAMIYGAIDPYVTASAPVSGGGGLTDIAVRSNLTPAPALEQVIGPLVVAVPAESRPPDANGVLQTQCASGQRSVRWVVNDLTVSREIEIACLNPSELDAQMTVVVANVANKEVRCARTGPGGVFRTPIPASVGDRIDIQVYTAPDVVGSYKTCDLQVGAPVGRDINSWEQPATAFTAVADPSITCTSSTGCQQFRESFYDVGSTLVAPQEGMGLLRQTPDFRKLMSLVQAALDPADPINFAPLYMIRPTRDLDGNTMPPRPILDSHTIGDPIVVIGAGLAFSRAAGLLPFLPPTATASMPEYADYATPQALMDAFGGKTPNDALIASYELEGVARLGRVPGKNCGINFTAGPQCTAPSPPDATTCEDTLFDADWIGEGTQNWGQQHLSPPMRLARVTGQHTTDAASLVSAWSPRLLGAPFAPDGSWPANQPVDALLDAYLAPLGQHDWSTGDPCQTFDGTNYVDNLLVHLFATGGQDLYYLSHPTTHRCLADLSCPFFPR